LFCNNIIWCWNGISGKGTFGWEYVELDLLKYVPATYRDEVRVKFNYTQYQWAGCSGTGYGWYVDNVEVKVSTQSVTTNPDQWDRHNFGTTGANGAHAGNYAWQYLSPSSSLKAGVDASLITKQIDLSSARNATLNAYLRFNINTGAGNPPDGFRVEVSSDNGMTWKAINLGVRSSWNYSGAESDLSDGVSDGKSYSGIPENGGTGTYGWVRSNTLTRLNCDLSGWAGSTIMLRIRVVTTDNSTYTHYADNTYPSSICVDDVNIYGESTARVMSLSDYFT
jgi:hypothetical protein